MRIFLKAQSMLEFCILAVVIMVALMSMQAYMKRGLQGRWKESVDQLGEQYDKSMSGTITHSTFSNTSTRVDGTARTDTDNSTETTSGYLQGSL